MRKFSTRALAVCGIAGAAIFAAAPAMASELGLGQQHAPQQGRWQAGNDPVATTAQGQGARQGNLNRQQGTAASKARQNAPAVNRSLVSVGEQGIGQTNSTTADPSVTNANGTKQGQRQGQLGASTSGSPITAGQPQQQAPQQAQPLR